MNRNALTILVFLIGALLQQLLPGWALFGGLKPPILAAITLHYALRRSGRGVWVIIFSAAVLQDGLDMGPFGPALIAFSAIGLGAQRIRNEIFSNGIITQLVLGALIGLITVITALVFYTLTGQRHIMPGAALFRMFGAFWLGMFTVPLVSRAINRMEAALPKRRGYGWQ